MTLEEYKSAIKAATTEEELRQLRFKSMLDDPKPMNFDFFTVRPKTLYDTVERLTKKRAYELGFIGDDEYVATNDNGVYVDKAKLQRLKNASLAAFKAACEASGEVI